jgi:sugar lactone lactonase YvrE
MSKKVNRLFLPLLLVAITSCTFPDNLSAINTGQVSTAKVYTADFGQGKKGANLTLKINSETGSFNTKANSNGNSIYYAATTIRSYKLYVVKSTLGTGYYHTDPIATDLVGIPVNVDVGPAASHTILLNNIPNSTDQFGTGDYYYIAVRAYSGLNASGTELIKTNNGGQPWTGATANIKLAVSTGAGIQVLSDSYTVSSTTDMTININLITAYGAGIETIISPNNGVIEPLSSLVTYGARVYHIAGTGAGGNDATSSAPATSIKLNNPRGLDVDKDGNIYIANTTNHTIRKVTPDGIMTTIAGTSGVSGTTSTRLNTPSEVAVDGVGNVIIADTTNNAIRKLPPGGTLTTVAGTIGSTLSVLNGPQGIAVDIAGNIYIADSGNDVIRKMTPTGTLTTIAGTGVGGDDPVASGAATSIKLNNPQGIDVDEAGNVYIANTDNGTIRKVDTSGTMTTVAGSGGVGTTPIAPAAATSVQLNVPRGVIVDSIGNLYITLTTGNVVKKVTPSGMMTTIAGTGSASGNLLAVGPATSYNLNNPRAIDLDKKGNLYIGLSGNDTVRKIK